MVLPLLRVKHPGQSHEETAYHGGYSCHIHGSCGPPKSLLAAEHQNWALDLACFKGIGLTKLGLIELQRIGAVRGNVWHFYIYKHNANQM